MDVTRLHELLADVTSPYRKGAEVASKGNGVTEVYAMPHESDADAGLVMVDCHFMTIGVDKVKAEARRGELVDLLAGYPAGRLVAGPSYIEVGGRIGDQGAVFRLFAVGEALGLWKVITPRTMGIGGTTADQLAGQGFVMMSGYKPT